MELEVVKEQERLRRLKRKVVTTEGIVFLPSNNPVELEINREEIKWKYSKTEIRCETWGDDTVHVPKSSICDMNSIRQVWNLGI